MIRTGVLCASVLWCAPGCQSAGRDVSAQGIGEMASGVLDAGAPIDSGSTRGLEVRLWVVDDTDRAAARGLTPYIDDFEEVSGDGRSDPISARTRSRWSDWGFRIITIPMDQVEGFLGQLRPVQPISVQWLGEFGHWRAIVRAGELGSEHVRVGSRLVEIDRGRPRLIARSWVEPMFTPRDVIPAVRLDLGMQIEIRDSRLRRQRQMGFFEPGRERSIEDDGPVIDELILSAMLDGSSALIIMGEAPGVDWNELPELPELSGPTEETVIGQDAGQAGDQGSGGFGPSEHQKQAQEEAQEQPGQTTRADQQGRGGRSGPRIDQPAKPMGQSLGELMLTSPGSRTTRLNQARIVPKRVIVVLIPRVEGGYSLLPRSPGQIKEKESSP